MSEEGAGVYAEALHEAAEQAGQVPAVRRDLSAFVRSLAESPALARVLFNPAFPAAGKRRILDRLTEGSDGLVVNVLRVLQDHGRLDLLPELERRFTSMVRADDRELTVRVTTAVPLDDAEASAIADRIGAATGGLRITLQRHVDADIIGGLVLRVGDRIVDASLRRRLDALERTLAATRLPADA